MALLTIPHRARLARFGWKTSELNKFIRITLGLRINIREFSRIRDKMTCQQPPIKKNIRNSRKTDISAYAPDRLGLAQTSQREISVWEKINFFRPGRNTKLPREEIILANYCKTV